MRIKVESKKLSSEECKVLANITKSARKGTPLESERSVDDIASLPAQKFYRKYGFEDVYYKQFYYWSP